MLRRSHIRTADLVATGVLPDLAKVDPYVLSRVDIDGASFSTILSNPENIYDSSRHLPHPSPSPAS